MQGENFLVGTPPSREVSLHFDNVIKVTTGEKYVADI